MAAMSSIKYNNSPVPKMQGDVMQKTSNQKASKQLLTPAKIVQNISGSVESLHKHVKRSPQYASFNQNRQLEYSKTNVAARGSVLPGINKPKAYNDNYRSLNQRVVPRRNHLLARSNDSLSSNQFYDAHLDLDHTFDSQTNLQSREHGNLLSYPSKNYLTNDGSLVNLGDFDQTFNSNSHENLRQIHTNLATVQGLR